MTRIKLDNNSSNDTSINQVEAFGGDTKRYTGSRRRARELTRLQNTIPPTTRNTPTYKGAKGK
jgi:hypothetical protein